MFNEPDPSTYHCLAGVPGRQFSASIAFLGAAHVASATGGKKLRTRNASRRVARAGRYRRAGVMTGSFRIQSAKEMLPSRESQTEANTNRQNFSSPGPL